MSTVIPSFPLNNFMRHTYYNKDTDTYNQLIDILKLPSHRKNDDRCKYIINILKTTEFFNKFSYSLCNDIAKIATYVKYFKDEILFYQGSIGTTFFLVLSDDIGYEVGVLNEGKTFGEISLLTDNSLRPATLVALDDCELLVVEKSDYDKIIKFSTDGEYRQKLNFCSEVTLFNGCTTRELSKVAAVMTKQRFERNTILLKQGSESSFFYFIQLGECRVIHRMKVAKTKVGAPNINHNKYNNGSMSARAPLSDNNNKSDNFKLPPLSARMRSIAVDTTPPDEVTYELADLGILGPKQFFGELGILSNKPCSASVYCKTTVEVWMIPRSDFLRLPFNILESFRAYADYYPSFVDMKTQIQNQQTWESFKSRLLAKRT